MSLREGYLHDYLAAGFIGLAFGMVISGTAAGVVGNWGPYIGVLFVAGVFGFIPAGFIAGYVNFRLHQMGENKEMAGLTAGFFTAFVYLIIDLVIALMLAIIDTAAAANIFIAWIISVVFAFIFMPVGGYLSGFLEGRPFAMPGFFNFSHMLSRAPPAPPPPPSATTQLCPDCNKPLTFVEQHNRWYCPNCKKYP